MSSEHSYRTHENDLTQPPLVFAPKSLTYHIRQENLPAVHTPEEIPHIHVVDVTGEEVAMHVLPGDTARELVHMGLHYIALGLALRERHAPGDWPAGWDEHYAGPDAAQHLFVSEQRPQS